MAFFKRPQNEMYLSPNHPDRQNVVINIRQGERKRSKKKNGYKCIILFGFGIGILTTAILYFILIWSHHVKGQNDSVNSAVGLKPHPPSKNGGMSNSMKKIQGGEISETGEKQMHSNDPSVQKLLMEMKKNGEEQIDHQNNLHQQPTASEKALIEASCSKLLSEEKPEDSSVIDKQMKEHQNNWFPSVDFKGGDLKDKGLFTEVMTTNACCHHCLDNGDCVAFTFVSKDHSCWLKQVVPPRVNNAAGLVSGTIQGRKPSREAIDQANLKLQQKQKQQAQPIKEKVISCCNNDANRKDNDLKLQPKEKFNDKAPFKSPSQYKVPNLVADTPASSWAEAFPVGNGFMGALLWGSTWNERIPISEDTMYTRPPAPKPVKNGQAPPAAKPSQFESFQAVRHHLLLGDIPSAEKYAGGMSAGGLGTFQYMSALNLIIRKDVDSIDRAKHKEKVDTKMPTEFSKLKGKERATAISEWRNMIAEKQQTIREKEEKDTPPIEQYNRELDLNTAISTTSFIYQPVINSDNKRTKQYHFRESFMSYPHKIFSMSLKCSKTESDNGSKGCLNMLLNFERDGDVDNDDDSIEDSEGGILQKTVKYVKDIDQWAVPAGHLEKGYFSISGGKVNPIAGDGSNINVKRNSWTLCGIVTPQDEDNALDGSSHNQARLKIGDQHKFIEVLEAKHVNVLIAATSSYRDENTENTCMQRLQQASALSYEELKATHIADHKELFQRTSLQLQGPSFATLSEKKDTENLNKNHESNHQEKIADNSEKAEQIIKVDLSSEYSGCDETDFLTGVRINRLGQTCSIADLASIEEKKKDPKSPSSVAASSKEDNLDKSKFLVQDPQLMSQWFAFSRYLLIASSRPGSQPANLQGVWADGLDAPWSGDYHLNINLQMCYWGAQTLNLGETTEPLQRFLDKLAKAGTRTARELYHVGEEALEDVETEEGKAEEGEMATLTKGGGNSAWVAHGYVDINIDANPHGDLQWSLCPTCGAWAALQIWDNFLYDQNITALRLALPVLRGSVQFFEQYLALEPTKTKVDEKNIHATDKKIQLSMMDQIQQENLQRQIVFPSLYGSSVLNEKNEENQQAHSNHEIRDEINHEPGSETGNNHETGSDSSIWPSWVSSIFQRGENSQSAPSTTMYQNMRKPGDLLKLLFQNWKQDSLMTSESGAMNIWTKHFLLLSGPSTSPENSYFKQPITTGQQQSPPPATKAEAPLTPEALKGMDPATAAAALQVQKRKALPGKKEPSPFHHLTMHPAIDNAVIASLLRAYSSAVKILKASGQLSQIELDSTWAETADLMLKHLPNQGQPMVSPSTGFVNEYLLDYEEPDPGHRHWSGLWSVFPGHELKRHRHHETSHIPKQNNKEDGSGSDIDTRNRKDPLTLLTGAARRTFHHKIKAGGGHTGWSAAWAVGIGASLRDPSQAYQSLLRLIGEFSTPNLLSTHPPIKPIKNQKGCATCFEPSDEAKRRGKQGASASIKQPSSGRFSRGLATTMGDVFQIDGNLGGAASMSEMLIQSYWDVAPIHHASENAERSKLSEHTSTITSMDENKKKSSQWLSHIFESSTAINTLSQGKVEDKKESDLNLVSEVDILPALPLNEWQSGLINGVRTKGGLEVTSLTWHTSSITDYVSQNHLETCPVMSTNQNPSNFGGEGVASEKISEDVLYGEGIKQYNKYTSCRAVGGETHHLFHNNDRVLSGLEFIISRPFSANNIESVKKDDDISDLKQRQYLIEEHVSLSLHEASIIRVLTPVPVHVFAWKCEKKKRTDSSSQAANRLKNEGKYNLFLAKWISSISGKDVGAGDIASGGDVDDDACNGEWVYTKHDLLQENNLKIGRGESLFSSTFVLDLPPMPSGAEVMLRPVQ